MNLSLPSSFANAISPFAPMGKVAVGQESLESKETTFKALEEPAETERSANRASNERTDDLNNPGEDAIRDRQRRETAEKQQEQQDQAIIQELAARDREVRAHEQAHAAVGGQYAGAPRYEFQRGPDGVSYAIGGEVSISTGAVPNDPEATIAKAQQVQRAALAPADPSPQDRAVAAEAASVELAAIAELAQMRRDEAELEREERNARLDEEAEIKAQEEDELEAAREADRLAADESAAIADQGVQRNIDLGQRLQQIGAVPNPNPVGELFNRIA